MPPLGLCQVEAQRLDCDVQHVIRRVGAVKATPDEPGTWARLHPQLRESWGRSAENLADPADAVAPIQFDDAGLSDYRRHHPLARVLPLFQHFLVGPAAAAGLVVAIGDAHGCLLWVDGDHRMRRQAEAGAFQPGANWSEAAIGTSAPGMALFTGTGAQVHREEHYAHSAHAFSCSAAPIRHPHTGALLGVVDLTGGQEAIATHSLPLIYAAIGAAESELRSLTQLPSAARLRSLGTLNPQLSAGAEQVNLTLRHAEILLLLAWHQGQRGKPGLSAGELAELLYGEPGHEVALRAELVRLRRQLRTSPAAAELELLSRPYRLSTELDVDAVEAARVLTIGQRHAALDLYLGEVLPASEAPGVLDIRRELATLLRESLLSDGSGQQLWQYLQLPEAAEDHGALYAALSRLDPESPLRAALVARTQR